MIASEARGVASWSVVTSILSYMVKLMAQRRTQDYKHTQTQTPQTHAGLTPKVGGRGDRDSGGC